MDVGSADWRLERQRPDLRHDRRNLATPHQTVRGEESGSRSKIEAARLEPRHEWGFRDEFAAYAGRPNNSKPVKGDFDRNGVVSVADVQAMMTALTDLSGYSATNHLSLPDDLVQLGDFDSDMKVTNLDLQGLLNLLANNSGGGSMSAVPEPTSVALICIGGLFVFGLRKRESG